MWASAGAPDNNERKGGGQLDTGCLYVSASGLWMRCDQLTSLTSIVRGLHSQTPSQNKSLSTVVFLFCGQVFCHSAKRSAISSLSTSAFPFPWSLLPPPLPLSCWPPTEGGGNREGEQVGSAPHRGLTSLPQAVGNNIQAPKGIIVRPGELGTQGTEDHFWE